MNKWCKWGVLGDMCLLKYADILFKNTQKKSFIFLERRNS